MAFRFEGLEVFQLAIEFARMSYELTRAFPKDERFGLTANLRRASTSVALNTAEGAGRGTRRDFMRFLDMAVGSVFEVVASFMIAERLGFLTQGDLVEVREAADKLGRKLSSFKNTLANPSPHTNPGRQ